MAKKPISLRHKEIMGQLSLIVVLSAILVVTTMCGCGVGEYSDGERSGIVTKISKRGIIWKTWEGCLALTQSAESCWNFSVTDESFVKAIQEASKVGKRITIKYSQRIFPTSPWQSSSQYWVTGISE